MQRFIDRNRAAGRQRYALRTDRLVLVGQLHLAKKNVGTILPPQFFGSVGILLHIFTDLLHRHLVFRNNAAVNEHATDRSVAVAVMRFVVQPHHRPVLDANARRTLNLDEQQIGLTFQPHNFKAAAGDCAIFDFGAVVIRHQFAAADLAKHIALVG